MFEKEAEEYTVENVCGSCYFEKPCENKCEAFGCADSKTYVLKAFKDGAEFGYNKGKAETALLSQHILDLQKDKGNLTDRVRELDQQIEKMKEIVSEMYVLICDKCESRNCAFCSVKEKWQMFKE